jgi:hypothetical protein
MATQQSIPQSTEQSKCTVVQFPEPKPQTQSRVSRARNRHKVGEIVAFPNLPLVTEEDLLEYKILSKEAILAAKKLAGKRKEIVALLHAGSSAEKGVLSARLVTVNRSGKCIERLEVGF